MGPVRTIPIQRILTIAVLLSAIFSSMATWPASAAGAGKAYGTVKSERTGARIPHAKVALKGTTKYVLADAYGRYVIAAIPAGAHTLVFSKPGFATRSRAFSMPPDGTLRLNAAVKRPARLVGYVRNKSGTGIYGATVRVAGTTIAGRSNAYGRYALSRVPLGTRTVVASHSRYLVKSRTATTSAGITGRLDFSITKMATITGKVTARATGRAVGGVRIWVKGTSLAASTDRYGNYIIKRVPAGARTLATGKYGYDTVTRSLTVSNDRTIRSDVGMAALSPKLTVTPQAATAGAAVSISGSGFGKLLKGAVSFEGTVVGTFTTSSAGAFSLKWTVPAATATGAHTLRASTSAASTSAALQVQAPATTSSPPADPVALGAYVSGVQSDLTRLDRFTDMVGRVPAVVMWYQDWEHAGSREFDRARMTAVMSRGATPMVTWEPWDYTAGTSQPKYALSTIITGRHDAYIGQWARDAAAWGQPMYVRFAHEMNARYYPWSAGVNGNTSAEYVSAWRHVVAIFRQAGATNVRWVWAPNVAYDGTTPFFELYPGDTYVDWVGLDGYNGGTALPWGGWQSIGQIFGASYDALAAMTSKPVMLSETASAEAGGDKAAWIRQGLLDEVSSRLPRVRAVIWFHENKETDWRVNSSPAALEAFIEVAASPKYQGRLP